MIKKVSKTAHFICSHPLARRQKFEAIKRWILWQIKSRASLEHITVPWIENAVLKIKRGMTGATGNVYCGLHEFEDMALLLHFFSNDQGLFLDTGANIGSYTILASKVGRAKTIAVEPVASTAAALRENIQANLIGEKVEVFQAAVGGKAGKVWFSLDRDTTNQVVEMAYSGTKELIEVQTIDQILDGRPAEFWKVDVEGLEEEVLAGAATSLRNPKVQVILLEGDSEKIRSIMATNHFKKAQYDPFEKQIRELKAGEPGAGANNLWVRDPDQITARCRKARPIHVYGQII